MDYLRKLKIPDYLSLVSLFFAWLSIVAILKNSPNFSIVFMLSAFSFDFLDGYFARKLNIASKKGRIFDSFVDIFTYSVFSALFYLSFLSPNISSGIIVGFFITSFGVLRLLRYIDEGILKDKKGNYYRGITVLHINVFIISGYLIKSFTGFWDGGIFSLLLFFLSVFMLSNHKTYKIENYYIVFLFVIIFAMLALLLEYAY